jgi:hypothetical protein
MRHLKRTFIPIVATGLWVNLSETLRWVFLVRSYWVEHYETMNLVYPDTAINGLVWMVWGFLIAVTIFILSTKFDLLKTVFLTWFVVFVMGWLVLWNMDTLPTGILVFVVPLSLLEIYIGALICIKLSAASRSVAARPAAA